MEKWAPVEGYEGVFEISSYGRVKRLKQYNVLRRNQYGDYYANYEEMIMKVSRDTHGYPQVRLFWNGKDKVARVHRLVALAFIPNPYGLEQVHHKDHDRSNPNVDNLEWVDHKTNQNYSKTENSRKWVRGELSGKSKLTNDQVISIYTLAREGDLNYTDIGLIYGISRSAVSNIKTKKTWREVTDPLDIH